MIKGDTRMYKHKNTKYHKISVNVIIVPERQDTALAVENCDKETKAIRRIMIYKYLKNTRHYRNHVTVV